MVIVESVCGDSELVGSGDERVAGGGSEGGICNDYRNGERRWRRAVDFSAMRDQDIGQFEITLSGGEVQSGDTQRLGVYACAGAQQKIGYVDVLVSIGGVGEQGDIVRPTFADAIRVGFDQGLDMVPETEKGGRTDGNGGAQVRQVAC